MRGVLIDADVPASLDARYELHPHVALRPEPFGALAYHYDNRRLVFLRKPEVLRVIDALAGEPSLRAALVASKIDERRWPSFVKAVDDLTKSEIIRVRTK